MPYQKESEVQKKDPQSWVSKDEPMTGAQASYLKALCEQQGEKFYENLSKAQASAQINTLLRKKTSPIT